MKRDMTTTSSAERDVEFLQCEQAGMSAAQMAERFNVSTRTIERWRNRLGVTHCAQTPRMPDSARRQAEYLLDQGCSFSETARTVGVSWKTIYRWFPDRHPWSRQEVVEFAVMVRAMGRLAA